MRADSNTPLSGTDVCIRQASCGAWERNASQTRLWPEVWEFKTVYFITASSTRDRKTLLFPETFSQIWWRGSDYPTLGRVPLIWPTAVPRGMCCSERPGLGYVYLWGTEVWGWERYPYLNHPGRKAGFPEQQDKNRTYKKHMPSPWTSLHCTMIVSHFSLILDSELLHSKEGHICDSHNVSRRWLNLDLTHLKREEKRIPKHLGLVPMWHLL